MAARPAVGRLAPTPSGALHLGNITAFAACWLSIRQQEGTLLLRIEDVDHSRARRHVETAQKRDLEWLGLTWDEEVAPQRDRDYSTALSELSATYFCGCTRKTIARGGGLHPLSCRSEDTPTGAVRYALPDEVVVFYDRVHGEQIVRPLDFGDPVLRRRDGVFTYTLAVVADDIADGVTEVVRGADLLAFTAVQIVLWRALDAEPPTWLHATLVEAADGNKLSKSEGHAGIAHLRESGWSPSQVWALVLPWLGLEGDDLAAAVDGFDPAHIPRTPVCVDEHWSKRPDMR